MSTQPFDYAMILADLEAKRAAIDNSIAAIRAAMGAGAVNLGDGQSAFAGGVVPSQVVPSITGNEIPDGAFFGKSLPEAARLLLEIVKKKLTTREIAEGLRKGGIESTSNDFTGIVHAVLRRARQAPNSSLVKVGSYWGLKEWWPKGIVSAGAPSKPKKRKKKPGKTQKRPEATSSSEETKQTTPEPPATVRIEELLRSKAGAELSAQDIAANFSMNANVAMMLLGKLVKSGHVQKTNDGTYRYASGHSKAVVQ